MKKPLSVAVLGATGIVGEKIIEILQERHFPIKTLYPLASHRSQGATVLFQNKPVLVQDVANFDFSLADIALFSAGASVSAKYAPIATSKGCVVIDNTSHYRQEADVPLIIPEVNLHALKGYTQRKIIANPNCSTMQMLVALKPLYDAVGITRINVTTYQSVSGSGRLAIDELAEQTQAVLSGRMPTAKVYKTPIAFNLIPHIDVFEPNGYTKEEMKMVRETQKILEDSQIVVNPTAVRVPVFYGHSEAIHIETKSKISAKEARAILSQAPGVTVKDALEDGAYPTPTLDAVSNDQVFVGRIREDISHPNGLNMWVVSDNIRKGAALNSVQIAEQLVKGNF